MSVEMALPKLKLNDTHARWYEPRIKRRVALPEIALKKRYSYLVALNEKNSFFKQICNSTCSTVDPAAASP
jgi:hypothetical protein